MTPWISVVTLIGLSCAAEPPSASKLTESEFRKLHQQLFSSSPRAWNSIPWHVSIQEARRLAIKEKKPILVWSQNGHPLGGC